MAWSMVAYCFEKSGQGITLWCLICVNVGKINLLLTTFWLVSEGTYPIHGYVHDWLSTFCWALCPRRYEKTLHRPSVGSSRSSSGLLNNIRGSLRSWYILNQFAVSPPLALAWRPLCLSMLGTAKNKKFACVCLRFFCGLFAPGAKLYSLPCHCGQWQGEREEP